MEGIFLFNLIVITHSNSLLSQTKLPVAKNIRTKKNETLPQQYKRMLPLLRPMCDEWLRLHADDDYGKNKKPARTCIFVVFTFFLHFMFPFFFSIRFVLHHDGDVHCFP